MKKEKKKRVIRTVRPSNMIDSVQALKDKATMIELRQRENTQFRAKSSILTNLELALQGIAA